MLKKTFSYFLSIITLLFFASISQAQDKLSLMLDWYVNPNHAPIIIAQEKGYFAKAGLDVEVIAPADPSLPPKMVAAGKVDIAVSYQAQLHLQRREELPLQRVGTLIATPLNCMMVNKASGINSVSELKGKKIGLSVSGVDDALINAMLMHNNLSLDDVELVNVNWALTSALMSNQVDAVIGAYRNFELTQMEIAGGEGRCFYIEEEGIPTHDELIYVANEASMDKEKIARFLKATERATSYIVNHPMEAWEAFAATSEDLNDVLNKRAFQDTLARFALRPSALDLKRYEIFDAFLRERGIVEGETDINKMAIDVYQF